MPASKPRNMETFNLIIAGDGHFSDYHLLKIKVDELLSGKVTTLEIVILSDAKKGASILGEQYACERGYEVAEFLKDDETGSSTIFEVNKKMVELADACICFWDGKSSHCRHLISVVNSFGLPLTTVNY